MSTSTKADRMKNWFVQIEEMKPNCAYVLFSLLWYETGQTRSGWWYRKKKKHEAWNERNENEHYIIDTHIGYNMSINKAHSKSNYTCDLCVSLNYGWSLSIRASMIQLFCLELLFEKKNFFFAVNTCCQSTFRNNCSNSKNCIIY